MVFKRKKKTLLWFWAYSSGNKTISPCSSIKVPLLTCSCAQRTCDCQRTSCRRGFSLLWQCRFWGLKTRPHCSNPEDQVISLAQGSILFSLFFFFSACGILGFRFLRFIFSVPSEFPGWMVCCLTHVGNDLAIILSSIVPVVFLIMATKYSTKRNWERKRFWFTAWRHSPFWEGRHRNRSLVQGPRLWTDALHIQTGSSWLRQSFREMLSLASMLSELFPRWF